MLQHVSDPQESPIARPPAAAANRRLPLICALLVAVSVLATVPVLEMGVNDDWSYTWTARELARTGHLTYNGWATAMIGVQAYWAALWIRLFGFSFTLVRLTTLPFAAGCAALLYVLGRRAGLAPRLAAFGALTVTLSPVFTPLAASFMSDVPGFFFFLLCLYAADRALETADAPLPTQAGGWLALLVISGLLGGTIRQIDWIAPGAFLPYLAWLRRADRRFVVTTLLLWLVTVAVALWCMHWFKQQPYSIIERPTQGIKALLRGLPQSLSPLRPLFLTTLLLALPAVACALPAWRPLARRRPGLVLSATFLAVVVPFALWRGRTFLAPWMGNIITTHGTIGAWVTSFGDQPVTLPKGVCVALSVAVYVFVGLLLATCIDYFQERRQGRHEPVTPTPALMRLWLLYSLCYVPLLVLRMSTDGCFDRYLIFVLPAAVFAVLRHQQGQVGERVAAAGGITLALFALYGIATTHDYLAMGRARLAAATELTKSGVPRTDIMAGFEYDGWTQLEQTGYYNDHRITNPPGAGHAVVRPAWPMAGHSYFTNDVPSIRYDYFITLTPQSELAPTRFPNVSYMTWLPPSHRTISIEQLPERQANS